jgi:glutathionylspermidine synthase
MSFVSKGKHLGSVSENEDYKKIDWELERKSDRYKKVEDLFLQNWIATSREEGRCRIFIDSYKDKGISIEEIEYFADDIVYRALNAHELIIEKIPNREMGRLTHSLKLRNDQLDTVRDTIKDRRIPSMRRVYKDALSV